MCSYPNIVRAGAVVWFIALASCAQPAPDDLAAREFTETTDVPPQFTRTTPVAGEVIDDWVSTFNDHRLKTLIDEALHNNRQLSAAAARVEQAAAAARQAGAALKPSIDLAAGAASGGNLSGGDLGNSYGAGLKMSWELDVWGRIGSARAAAEAQYQATEIDFLAAQQSLAAQTAKSWYLAIETQLQERHAEELVAIQRRFLKTAELQRDVGKARQQDVLLAHAALSSAEERLRQVRSSRQQAVRGMELLLGRYPKTELQLAADLPVVPPPPPAGLPSALLERRPDLLAAERSVAVAFNLKESAKAARLPRVGLTLTGGGVSGGLAGLLNSEGGFWSSGANFAAPVYQGGALKEQIAIETARQKEALAAYGQLALQAFKEVEDGLSDDVTLAERERFLATAAADHEQALRLVEAQYKVGKVDVRAVLQARVRTVNSLIATTRIRSDRLANRIDFHLALGGGFETSADRPAAATR